MVTVRGVWTASSRQYAGCSRQEGPSNRRFPVPEQSADCLWRWLQVGTHMVAVRVARAKGGWSEWGDEGRFDVGDDG